MRAFCGTGRARDNQPRSGRRLRADVAEAPLPRAVLAGRDLRVGVDVLRALLAEHTGDGQQSRRRAFVFVRQGQAYRRRSQRPLHVRGSPVSRRRLAGQSKEHVPVRSGLHESDRLSIHREIKL